MTTPFLLITRPSPLGESLVKDLQEQGFNAMHWPLTKIITTQTPAPEIAAINAIIATSQNAAKALQQQVWSLKKQIPVYAVGPQTANAFRALGFDDVRTPPQSAGWETLTAHILEKETTPITMLRLRGEPEKGHITQHLTTAGHHVVERCLYRAETEENIPQQVANSLASLPSETRLLVVHGSRHAALQWQHQRSKWQLKAKIGHIVLSQEIAAALPAQEPKHLISELSAIAIIEATLAQPD